MICFFALISAITEMILIAVASSKYGWRVGVMMVLLIVANSIISNAIGYGLDDESATEDEKKDDGQCGNG